MYTPLGQSAPVLQILRPFSWFAGVSLLACDTTLPPPALSPPEETCMMDVLQDLKPDPYLRARIDVERTVEKGLACLLSRVAVQQGLDTLPRCYDAADLTPAAFDDFWCGIPEEEQLSLDQLDLVAMDALNGWGNIWPADSTYRVAANLGSLRQRAVIEVMGYLSQAFLARGDYLDGWEPGDPGSDPDVAQRRCLEQGIQASEVLGLDLLTARFAEFMARYDNLEPGTQQYWSAVSDLGFQTLPSTFYTARNRGNHATHYEENDLDWPTARQWLTEAIAANGADDKIIGVVSFLTRLAGGEYDNGNLGRAEDLYGRVLRLKACGSVTHDAMGMARVGLGSVYLDLGDEERAQHMYQQVIGDTEMSTTSTSYLNAFANSRFIEVQQLRRLPRAQMDQARLKRLEESLRKILEQSDGRATGHLPLEIEHNRATLLLLMEDFEAARQVATGVRERARREVRPEWEIAATILLAEVARAEQQPDLAHDLYQTAYHQAEESQLPYWAWSTLQGEAALWQTQGRRAEALATLERTAHIVEDVWSRVSSYSGSPADHSARYLESKLGFYDEAVELLLSGKPTRNDVEQAWWWTQRRRSNDMRRKLGSWRQPGESTTHQQARDLLHQVQRQLAVAGPPRQVILEYHLSRRAGYVFVITKDSLDVHPLAEDGQALNERVLAAFPFLEEQGDRNGAVKVAESGALGKLILEPVLPDLKPGDLLRIVPDGALHLVPFELLPVGGRQLLDHYALAYTSSATLLLTPPPLSARGQDLLSLANDAGAPATALHGELLPVPCALQEGDRIHRRSGDLTLKGVDATEAEFNARAPQFDVLHLSAHGVAIQGDYWNTHVLLRGGDGQDGRLTLHEIAHMKLRARLAILSVCRSAVSQVFRGEGIQGIGTAFRQAGVPATVAGLWELPDVYGTVELIGGFMDRVRTGYGLAEALRQSKLALRDAGADSRVWAPLVLYGAPEAIYPYQGEVHPHLRPAQLSKTCQMDTSLWSRVKTMWVRWQE